MDSRGSVCAQGVCFGCGWLCCCLTDVVVSLAVCRRTVGLCGRKVADGGSAIFRRLPVHLACKSGSQFQDTISYFLWHEAVVVACSQEEVQ